MPAPRRLLAPAAALALAATAGCASAAATPGPSSDAAASRHFTGTLADGADWTADIPAHWTGTLLLFGHGFGPLKAKDAETPQARALLLHRGYALAGSSYDPHGSTWALQSAEHDQLDTATAFARAAGRRPHRTLSVGMSMGGLVNARLARDGKGKIDGAVGNCGLVAGGPDHAAYQLNGAYAAARLLLPANRRPALQGIPSSTAAHHIGTTLDRAVTTAQHTAAGRARTALVSALLNLPARGPGSTGPDPAAPARQEAGQAAWFRFKQGEFVYQTTIRYAQEKSAGGPVTGNAGTDYARLLADSPAKNEVTDLYRRAGLNLDGELADLTRHADQHPDPAAARRLAATSTDGHPAVPLLDIHTEADPIVAVQQENRYAGRVGAAGGAADLRQAYVDRAGHCAFRAAELAAAIGAVDHRVATGSWSAASTAALQHAAAALDPHAAYRPFTPGRLVIGPNQA